MDKKNILIEHTFRNNTFLCQIRERIENRKECLDYFAACLKHQEISDEVSKEFYYDKPITSFILKLYFMPLNLYKFICKLRMIHSYNKCSKELEILNEIGKNIYKN